MKLVNGKDDGSNVLVGFEVDSTDYESIDGINPEFLVSRCN